MAGMELECLAPVIEWRGPAPFVFVKLPPGVVDEISALAPLLSYGWGCIPVTGRIGDTAFRTSLFPRDGGYLLPVKAAVRRAEGIEVGEQVRVAVGLGGPPE